MGSENVDYWLLRWSNTTNTSKFDFGKKLSVVGVVYGAQTERDPSYGASFVQEAADLFRQGRVKPHIGKTFPLSQAAEAMDALLSRSYAGKIILTT